MFSIFRQISITYGITVCNEHTELQLLLDKLLTLIDKNDEIIVIHDITAPNHLVGEVLRKYSLNIKVIETKLNGDFSTFKNNIIHNANCRYIFQIDADELPTEQFIKILKPYLRREKSVDIFYVPRINIVEGITNEYIEKMGWKRNNEGYINFPDYQARILKNNKKIFWKNKVHEILTGNKNFTEIEKRYEYSLIHIKNFEKQKLQNKFYETLD